MPQYYKNLSSQCVSIYLPNRRKKPRPPKPCPPKPHPCPPHPPKPHPCPPHPCPPHPCPPHPCPPHPCPQDYIDKWYNKNSSVLTQLEKLLIEIDNDNKDFNNIYDDYLDYDESHYTNFIIVNSKNCNNKKKVNNKLKKTNFNCQKKLKCNNLEKAVEIAWKEGLVNNSSWTIVVKEGVYNVDQDLLNQTIFNFNNNHIKSSCNCNSDCECSKNNKCPPCPHWPPLPNKKSNTIRFIFEIGSIVYYTNYLFRLSDYYFNNVIVDGYGIFKNTCNKELNGIFLKTDCLNKKNIFKCNSRLISSKSLSVLIKNNSHIHLNTSSNCDEYSYKCIFNNQSNININCPYINSHNIELSNNCYKSKFELNTQLIKNYNFKSNNKLFNGEFKINSVDVKSKLFILPFVKKDSSVRVNIINDIDSKLLVGSSNNQDNLGCVCINVKNINNDLFIGNNCNYNTINEDGCTKINCYNVNNSKTILNTNCEIKFIVSEIANIEDFYVNINKGNFNINSLINNELIIYKLYELNGTFNNIKVNNKLLIEGSRENGTIIFNVNDIFKIYCNENKLFVENNGLVNFNVKILENNDILNIGNKNEDSKIIIKSKTLDHFFKILNKVNIKILNYE